MSCAERGNRRAHSPGRGRGAGRAAAGPAGSRRPLPAACLPPGGLAGSSRLPAPVTMTAHTTHCRLLMREPGVERAHVAATRPASWWRSSWRSTPPRPCGAAPAADRSPGTLRPRRHPARRPALPRRGPGRGGGHLPPRRLRARLPSRARPRPARGPRAGGHRRRRVLHPGTARSRIDSAGSGSVRFSIRNPALVAAVHSADSGSRQNRTGWSPCGVRQVSASSLVSK